MQFKNLFLATALTTLPVGAAIAQPAAAPEAGAAQTTTAPATGSATATGPAATAAATANPAAPTSLATPEDLKAGLTVFDSAGATVGTIESVTANGAVIVSGDLRAEVPVASFAKNDRGLVIGITKAEFEAAVSQAKS